MPEKMKLNDLFPGFPVMKGDYWIPAVSETPAASQDGEEEFLVNTENAGEEEIPPETEIRVGVDDQQNQFILPELEDMCADLLYSPTPLSLDYTVPQPTVDAEDTNAPPLRDFRHFSGRTWGDLQSNETPIVQTETRVLHSTAVDTETLAANTCELVSVTDKHTASASTSARRSRAANVHYRLEKLRRRNMIFRKIRILQELIVPTCHKMDETSVFDDYVRYIKCLELQVQVLSVIMNRRTLSYPPIANPPHLADPNQYPQMPYFADPNYQRLGWD